MTRRVLGVFGGVKMMRVREVRVMRGLLVVAGFVMLRGFRVVMRGHAVMMGCLAMFVHCLL